MSTFLYFAYGSNMLTSRLRGRCKTARPIGRAWADAYDVAFSKKSADGSGKATLIPMPVGHRHYGVMFEIALSELDALDRAEGAGHGYERIDRFPVTLIGSDPAEHVITYRASAVDPILKPYDWYLVLVIHGMIEHDFDPAQIACFRNVSYSNDPQPARKSRLEALDALRAAGIADPFAVLTSAATP
jgi:gamma-glutamylcyclotransferase